VNGVTNTGGGGGGGGYDGTDLNGGAGGSGVVIIRYPSTFLPATTTGASVIYNNNVGGYHVYTFNASGTITF
jgi:hypothetical protein